MQYKYWLVGFVHQCLIMAGSESLPSFVMDVIDLAGTILDVVCP